MAFIIRRPAPDPELGARLERLEHQAEMIRTVLMLKDPGSQQAAQAYDGLRKQVIAATSARRTHLVQLTAMSVALSRATSLEDLKPQIREWMDQAGIRQVHEVPDGHDAEDFFEGVGGHGIAGDVEIVEPAYVDAETGALIRLGRAVVKSTSADAPSEGGDR